MTVRSGNPPAIDASNSRTDVEPVPRLNIPVVPLASGTEMLPGAIEALAALVLSRGPGDRGGSGTGSGPGDGPGHGPGLGPGSNGNTGGDFYQVGGEVTAPVEIRKGAPQYTTAAVHARAEGTVLVECVVQTNGVCTNIRVKRSFDPGYGLDQEAIKAAAQWRFRPGLRRGQPVPVLVTMEIAFTLR